MFVLGQLYTKRDIYKILNVPSQKQRGEWDKGYRSYEGNIFIFSNINIPGRTGHDYNNYWDGDLFVWEATNQSHLNQPQIIRMVSPPPGQKIFLFTRTDDRSPFTYEGNVVARKYFDTKPVKIVWGFERYPYETIDEKEPSIITEGKVTKIYVNKYERNPLARRMCIEHHGVCCKVCGFDFYDTYGDLGKDYIHVHHLIPISSIRKKYTLVPEKDLIPVCPNCHAMIHKKTPALSIEQLREIIGKKGDIK